MRMAVSQIARTIRQVACLSGLALVAACGGSGTGTPNAGSPGGNKATATLRWTLAGSITVPAAEKATNLKLVVAEDPNTHSAANNYLNTPVALNPTGSPPTATFSTTLDSSTWSSMPSQANVELYVFNDANDDGIMQFSETWTNLATSNPASSVWCNGTTCTNTPFFHYTVGESCSSANGNASLTTAGWYYQQGCNDCTCAKLISTSNDNLSGVLLSYSVPVVP